MNYQEVVDLEAPKVENEFNDVNLMEEKPIVESAEQTVLVENNSETVLEEKQDEIQEEDIKEIIKDTENVVSEQSPVTKIPFVTKEEEESLETIIEKLEPKEPKEEMVLVSQDLEKKSVWEKYSPPFCSIQ